MGIPAMSAPSIMTPDSFAIPVKFVLPWYGKDIAGGAETLARAWCEQLARRRYEVEVLTTCGKAVYENWNENAHPEGVEAIEGVRVRRFKVRPGNHRVYNELNRRLLLGARLTRAEEEAFITESIRSVAMEAHIRDRCSGAALVFLPYLYGVTYWGARARPDRSFLLPCLHNESYAAMSVIADLHRSVRGVIFNAEKEKELAERLYQLGDKPQIVLGMGIDTDISPDATRFRRQTGIQGDVLCYFGRRDATKNTPALVDFFSRYLDETGRDVHLALGGKGDFEVPSRHRRRIHDLGFVSEEMKLDTCAASVALCQPSDNESFSIVLMESWLCGTPVLVNGFCDVTRDHCLRSNGGLYFRNYGEFLECLQFLLDHPQERAAMGRQGRRYVLDHFRWDALIERLAQFLKDSLVP